MAKDIQIKGQPEPTATANGELPEPKTFALLTSRDMTVDGHDIPAHSILGEITCRHGLSPDWLMSVNGRVVYHQEIK